MLKVQIYDVTNEDDDFVDLDKDDLTLLIKQTGGGEDGEQPLPMPILASGFDFEDYVPDFTK